MWGLVLMAIKNTLTTKDGKITKGSKHLRAKENVSIPFDSKKWITIKKPQSLYRSNVKTNEQGLPNVFHDFLLISVFTPYWTDGGTRGRYLVDRCTGYKCPYEGYRRFDRKKMRNWLLENYTKEEMEHGVYCLKKYANHLMTFSIYDDSPIFKICPKPLTLMESKYNARGATVTYQNQTMFLSDDFINWFTDVTNKYDIYKTKKEMDSYTELVNHIEKNVRKMITERTKELTDSEIDLDEYFKGRFRDLILGSNDKYTMGRGIETYYRQIQTADIESYPYAPLEVKEYTSSELTEMFWTKVKQISKEVVKQRQYTSIRDSFLDLIDEDLPSLPTVFGGNANFTKQLNLYHTVIENECLRSKLLIRYLGQYNYFGLAIERNSGLSLLSEILED